MSSGLLDFAHEAGWQGRQGGSARATSSSSLSSSLIDSFRYRYVTLREILEGGCLWSSLRRSEASYTGSHSQRGKVVCLTQAVGFECYFRSRSINGQPPQAVTCRADHYVYLLSPLPSGLSYASGLHTRHHCGDGRITSLPPSIAQPPHRPVSPRPLRVHMNQTTARVADSQHSTAPICSRCHCDPYSMLVGWLLVTIHLSTASRPFLKPRFPHRLHLFSS